MSTNRVVEPTCLPILLHDAHPKLRRELSDRGRAERPAWQSPYGPPPRRARRRRWAPVPVFARSRSALRRGHVCGRCD
ncbi:MULTISPECIES: hypothetical protein [Streptomyces]|uniref:Uncharacterized protein n=1 Tax=Streptomyces solicathayae TaxID=3081768 RepID=A0ABZ0LSI4_9ACTN|nr:hypothetical protein [Streptomyces sp. HUAS YS2]WOX22450.1 hypothetical protein R2D22_14010 [Streptomyces sp. HUAS YS2]